MLKKSILKSKSKLVLSFITNFFTSIVLVTFIISTFYFINISNSFNEVNISNISRKKSSKIYEYIGDLFAIGTKFPKNFSVASMFYGIAMTKAKEFGEDVNNLIFKINRLYS